VLTAAALAGCSADQIPSRTAGAAPGGAPPAGPGAPPAAGPGPQPRYTVHAAPAPGTCHYRYVHAKPLPDPGCTPGAINPEVTPSTLRRTICAPGYSARVRPPRAVTDREKQLSALAYGYTGSFSSAELDHLVPLGVGGDPNDPRNLWLEPNDDPRATTNANGKDDVETALHDAVCAGRVGLVEAQRAIAVNWTTALAVLGIA